MLSEPIFCSTQATVHVNGKDAKYTRDGNYVVVEIGKKSDLISCIEPNGFTVEVQNGDKTISLYEPGACKCNSQ